MTDVMTGKIRHDGGYYSFEVGEDDGLVWRYKHGQDRTLATNSEAELVRELMYQMGRIKTLKRLAEETLNAIEQGHSDDS